MRDTLVMQPGTYWGGPIRERIAIQIEAIRLWIIEQRSYETLSDMEATWFVDPPYNNKAGAAYKCNGLDYGQLGDWCQKRSGQVIACENAGADWLPFVPFRTI